MAVSYLQSGRYSLAEITYMLGFNDASSFSRAFKRWSGKAPGEYRAELSVLDPTRFDTMVSIRTSNEAGG
jgi:AraC-like DNA-binding protein